MDVRHDTPIDQPPTGPYTQPPSGARSTSRAAFTPHEPPAPGDGGLMGDERFPRHLNARQLAAAFASTADGIVWLNRDGRILAVNAAARRLLALDARPDFETLPHTEQLRLLHVRDALGHLVPMERIVSWSERLYTGHALSDADTGALTMRALDGRIVALSASAAPVRGAHGEVLGAVCVLRDVTELRQLGRRTPGALAALVAMAELLVAVDPWAPDTIADASRLPDRDAARSDGARVSRATSSDLAQQLAQLALTVMGCRQLDIIVEEAPHGELLLVASAGLTARGLRRWRASGPWHGHRLHELLPEALAARLERGESIPIDFADPSFAQMPNATGARSVLLTPMRAGGRLVGFLALDYGTSVHTFAPEEIALAAGTARLVALVLERERLLHEREEARASALALYEANRRMDEFLAVAAHELRSPVMAGLIAVELAQRRVRDIQTKARTREGDLAEMDELDEVLAQATESVERLSHLVATLLDTSRIQSGQLDIHPELADLAALVREAVARQQLLAPTRAIHLHLPAAERVPVFVDPDRMGQVVSNLVGNALKYTPENKPVAVQVQVRGGRVRVSVRDEGPGLPAEEQRRIWDRYHRAPSIQANTGTGGGLGLGLYVAREVVRAHGGRIGVRSSPGKGATFWFTLPLGG